MKFDDEERIAVAKRQGFRPSLMGEKPTYAICRHNSLLEITADDHSCSWMGLIREALNVDDRT